MSNENAAAGTDFATAIGGAVRDNPLSTALIGMGLVWLFGGRAPLRNGIGGAASGLSALGGRINEKVAATSRSIADTATSAAEGARTGVSTMANAVQSPPGLRSTLNDLFQRQPLLLGAIGLAIGAGVAASLPVTDAEKEYLGDASAEFQSKAMGIATESAQRASDIASGVATTIANEARVEGLTPAALMSSVLDAGNKLKRVADEASDAVQKQMHK
jgi:hypothetical protein